MNPYRALEDFKITLMDTLAPGTLPQTEITLLPPGVSLRSFLGRTVSL